MGELTLGRFLAGERVDERLGVRLRAEEKTRDDREFGAKSHGDCVTAKLACRRLVGNALVVLNDERANYLMRTRAREKRRARRQAAQKRELGVFARLKPIRVGG